MNHSPTASTAVLVDRKAEQQELADALCSGRPELIAIYGRRRVGKTYLVRTFYAEHLCFELTGVRKTVFVTIVSPYGVKPNQHSQALIQGVVTADDLFDG